MTEYNIDVVLSLSRLYCMPTLSSWFQQSTYVDMYLLFFILVNIDFLLPRPIVHMSGHTSAAIW